MAKLNCWEIKKCGRQQNGQQTGELGVCPAATEVKLHGAHGGTNAGRACWVVAGTLCGGKTAGTFATKLANCMDCNFYKQVITEEKTAFLKSPDLLKKLN